MAGMEMVVVMVSTPPPATEDRKVVVSNGHVIVVVERIGEGGSTSVQGGCLKLWLRHHRCHHPGPKSS